MLQILAASAPETASAFVELGLDALLVVEKMNRLHAESSIGAQHRGVEVDIGNVNRVAAAAGGLLRYMLGDLLEGPHGPDQRVRLRPVEEQPRGAPELAGAELRTAQCAATLTATGRPLIDWIEPGGTQVRTLYDIAGEFSAYAKLPALSLEPTDPVEFLREVAHLRPRTNTFGAVARVRHATARAIHSYFDENGYYWVNTHDLPSRPLYAIAALTLHEAAPGHHTQGALAKEQGEKPPFRRFDYISAYGEGWALYAEKLGVEMDIYETPYDHFGRLTYDMWRACRLVIDTGIHAMGWERQRALDYLASNTALSMHEITTEVDRYISWPAQALSYKLGEYTIRQLRAQAEAELGDEFDLLARDLGDRLRSLEAAGVSKLVCAVSPLSGCGHGRTPLRKSGSPGDGARAFAISP